MANDSSRARRSLALFVLLLLALGVSCGGKRPPKGEPPPRSARKGATQEGVASWYGNEFHGRPTASGEIFDQDGLTAAHRTLPLGTTAKVTNLENGKEVVLKVNDRGPFVRGRVLDCSRGAARALGFIGAGMAKVRIEVVEEGKRPARRQPAAGEVVAGQSLDGRPLFDGSFTVQVGAFGVEANALRLREKLEREFGEAYVVRFREFYRVRVGHLPSEEAAEALVRRLKDAGHGEGFVTRND